MKKQILSIFAALSVSTMIAQVPAAAWATNQNAIFPSTTAGLPGVKFMDAVDANVVWVIGRDWSNIRNPNWYSRTTNGGTSFTGGNVHTDTSTYIIANMEAIDANTAWVASFLKGGSNMGAIHRTTNGGTNWVNMTATGMYTNTASFANWVTFFTPSVGIANGDPNGGEFELWRTTDGGTSWTKIPGSSIPNPLSGEFAIVDLYAKVGTSNLWFGTNGNRIFRSTDAGLTYSVASVGPLTNTVTQIAFSSPLNGMCVMFNSSSTMELWNTTDGGVNWAQIPTISSNFGQSDIGQIPGTGKLVSYDWQPGSEIISYSSDNGVTWTSYGSVAIPYVTGDFVDGSTAWAGSFTFTDATPTTFTNIWKFSGSMTGTVVPTAAFSLPATICTAATNTAIPVNSSIGSGSLTYSWSTTGGVTLSSATASAPTITFPTTPGAYTVTLLATNSNGTNSTSWVVNVLACTAPVATFTLPAGGACSNFSFAPGNTSTGVPAPGYFWSISPSTNVTISPSPSGSSPAMKMGTAGIYSVTLLVSNASGTTQTTQTVNVAPCPPISNYTLVYACDAAHSFSTISATSNPPGASGSALSYTWSASPSTGVSYSPNRFSPNVKVVLGPTATGDYTFTAVVKNASGSTTVTEVITQDMYNCTVGIAENNLLSTNLSVYPNPAHEQLNIVLSGSNDTYKVKLTNILGSVVYEEKTFKNSRDNTVINLSNKPKGVYFLTVESNNEKVTKKIVID